jgi:uncharacterized membrane protein YkvA (DUF1232 family)
MDWVDMALLENLKRRARSLKADTYALYLVARDPRTPWYAKVLVGAVVAYALSPIDLIPDFIPVIGYLDDLILLPLGIALAIRLVPDEVLAECRARAEASIGEDKPVNLVAAAIVVGVWILLASLFAVWAWRALGRR